MGKIFEMICEMVVYALILIGAIALLADMLMSLTAC